MTIQKVLAAPLNPKVKNYKKKKEKNRSASVPPFTASRNRADGATSGPTGDCPFQVVTSRGFMIIWRTRRDTGESAKGDTDFSPEASKKLGSSK